MTPNVSRVTSTTPDQAAGSRSVPCPVRTASRAPATPASATTVEICVAIRKASRTGEAPRALHRATSRARRRTISRSIRNSAQSAPADSAPSTTADSRWLSDWVPRIFAARSFSPVVKVTSPLNWVTPSAAWSRAGPTADSALSVRRAGSTT
ncbi:hypothetical protein ACFQ9X_47870 [Catenulispora yoronensis]